MPTNFADIINSGLLILTVISIICVIIALPYILKQSKKSALRGTGKLIKATITQVISGKSPQHPGGLGRMYHFNPKLFYYIKCDYKEPKTKKVRSFYSWSLFIGPDPTPFLPKKVDVWVDPNSWQNYYVDVGILPDEIIRGNAQRMHEQS